MAKRLESSVEYGYGRRVEVIDEYGHDVVFFISNKIARELLWICKDILRDELNAPTPSVPIDTSAHFETLDGMKGLRA